ncbi:hypothetical protein LXA43DRAFT_1101802 [Ganoderma leucocontextum]|nr:hypothetical protein LXA43DRAFT_1101802 [Ganoderma leucocontextum]
MTVTFDFTGSDKLPGTFISAVGSLGSAPVLVPGIFTLNQTFFNSPTVDAGKHRPVIMNVSPNVVWLDYTLFAESAPSSTRSTTPSSATPYANLQPSGSQPAEGSHDSDVGSIVGGVVEGVA